MGKILPGIVVSFLNQKGGVGKTTLTILFADYLHTIGKNMGLKIGVIDTDDKQHSLSRKREREGNSENSYKVMSIASRDVPERIKELKDIYDIILIDFPGNMKQEGVVQTYYLLDVIFVPSEATELDMDSTFLFYEEYAEIIEARKKLGLNTVVNGVFNRVKENVLEFKTFYKNRNDLELTFLDLYVKDSNVKFQRNISTHADTFEPEVNAICEVFFDKIVEYAKEL